MSSAQLRQWTAASIVSVGLLMTGMFLGWPSPWVSKLRAGQTTLILTQEQVSWAISLLYVGSVLSPLAAGRLMDRYGRCAVLRATCVLSLASWLLLAFTDHVIGLYVARIISGMWGGISYCVTPVYLCEIAEPRVRGALNTMFTLMVYLGIMMEYAVGPLLSYTALCLASAAVPVIYFLGMLNIPESPYYFLMRGDKEKAKKALEWLRCNTDVERELNEIHSAVSLDMTNKGSVSDLFSSPRARRAFFMVEVVAFLQRMSGSSVIMAYISTSLPKSGLMSGDQCAVVMCSLWLLFGVGSTILMDRLGRKPLLAVSCLGCAVSTGSLTLWFYFTADPSVPVDGFNNVPVFCFLVYGLFYPIGLSCVPSIVQGELFPSNVKGLASAITSIVVALVSFVTNKLYQPLADTCGMYTNYLYFTLTSAYGIYFAMYVLLETRNKSLSQIHSELSHINQVKNETKELPS